MSHFKGHIVSGLGGAIKNLGMGCALPEGKRKQHNPRQFFLADRCTGCGTCVEVCPESAISIEGGKSVIRKGSCVGCFDCRHACREHALDIEREIEIPVFTERMVEYAYCAMRAKRKKPVF